MGGGEGWGEIQTKEPSKGKWQEKKLFQKKPKKKKSRRRRVALWYQTSLIITLPNYKVLKTGVFKYWQIFQCSVIGSHLYKATVCRFWKSCCMNPFINSKDTPNNITTLPWAVSVDSSASGGWIKSRTRRSCNGPASCVHNLLQKAQDKWTGHVWMPDSRLPNGCCMENRVRASAQLQRIPQRPSGGHRRQHFGVAFSRLSYQAKKDHRIDAQSKRTTHRWIWYEAD